MLLILHGYAYGHHSGVVALLLFAEDRQVGYDCHKSRLRTAMVVLVATKFSCGHAECCGNYRGRLKTARVLGWLQR